jgi:hypothetical protein
MTQYTASQKREAQKLARKVEVCRRTLEALEYPVLLELCRRADAEIGIDVYHSRMAVGNRSNFADSVVEQAIERTTPPDPVGNYIDEIRKRVNEVTVITRRLDFLMYVLTHGASGYRGLERESSLQGVCSIASCGEAPSGLGNDRLKAGFCPTHYPRWRSWRAQHPGSDPGAARRSFILWTEQDAIERNADSVPRDSQS